MCRGEGWGALIRMQLAARIVVLTWDNRVMELWFDILGAEASRVSVLCSLIGSLHMAMSRDDGLEISRDTLCRDQSRGYGHPLRTIASDRKWRCGAEKRDGVEDGSRQTRRYWALGRAGRPHHPLKRVFHTSNVSEPAQHAISSLPQYSWNRNQSTFLHWHLRAQPQLGSTLQLLYSRIWKSHPHRTQRRACG